eukprot:2253747-Amphidinium_carterae.1
MCLRAAWTDHTNRTGEQCTVGGLFETPGLSSSSKSNPRSSLKGKTESKRKADPQPEPKATSKKQKSTASGSKIVPPAAAPVSESATDMSDSASTDSD